MPRLPALSPHGRLFLDGTAEAAAFSADTGALLEAAFAKSSARGLLALAARRGESSRWPAEFAFWREFADAYLTALAHAPDASGGAVAMPPELAFNFTLRIPAMRGAEYASPELFAKLWSELDATAREEAAGGLREWLGRINPALHEAGASSDTPSGVILRLRGAPTSTVWGMAFLQIAVHFAAHSCPLHSFDFRSSS